MSEIVNFYISKKIKLGQSTIHGTGVFAVDDIDIDEVIEVSPLIKLDWKMKYVHDKVLRDYCWMNTRCECADCKMHGPALYLGLGYSSLYNHQDDPTCNLMADFAKLAISIKAKKRIEKDEEIFISYGEKYFNTPNRQNIKKEGTNEQEGTKHT